MSSVPSHDHGGPTTVAALLDLITADPGRPRVTWYGPAGERVELSGHVLDNWVAKTANLLVEELDAGPGERVVLDLPVHWRTVVWALAVWRVGACVLPVAAGTAPDAVAGGPATAVVTTRPAAWTGAPGTPEVVAVELAALARAFTGDLPAGTLDATGAVMTYGDVLTYAPPTDPAGPALDLGHGVVTFRDLPAWAREHAHDVAATDRDGAAPRVLLDVGPDLPRLLATASAVLAADGSLVLLHPEAGADRARLASTERVTAGA